MEQEHEISLKCHYLTKNQLHKPKQSITKKSKILHPYYLMEHPLFKKHRPTLIGGAALSFHHRSMVCKSHRNRDIDDFDFYVIDKSAYDEFKANRTIIHENKEAKIIHFYQKMLDDFYIKITISYRPEWKHKRYQPVMCVRVLELKELKILKKRQSYFGNDVSIYYRKNSPTKYFARNNKYHQDINDIQLINYLMKNSK